jgi:hypothetical protein
MGQTSLVPVRSENGPFPEVCPDNRDERTSRQSHGQFRPAAKYVRFIGTGKGDWGASDGRRGGIGKYVRFIGSRPAGQAGGAWAEVCPVNR